MSSAKPLTYHIFYGFMSGVRQSRELRAKLETAGFRYQENAQQADIIIAHSAGCWAVNEDLKAKLTVYVGMPLQQGKIVQTFRKSTRVNDQDVKQNGKKGKRIAHLHWFYLLKQLKRNIRIIRLAKQLMGLPDFVNRNSIFIVNKLDPWPDSPDLFAAVKKFPITFISLPGAHTHIWHQPDYYVEIIQSYAAGLLA